MFMTPNAQELCDALVRFEEMKTISLRDRQIFILLGDPIKYQVGIEGGGGGGGMG